MDGELDPADRMDIERHLQSCSQCAGHVRSGRAVQTALQTDSLYYSAPRGLESRVLTAVRAENKVWKPQTRSFVRPALALAALFSLLMIFWFISARTRDANREAVLTEQITCSHVRSLMANHLLDVASADPQTVNPWFIGKVNFTMPFVDLNRRDYLLRGGRLEYLNDHSAAALVYMRQQHVINLFFWPSVEPPLKTMRQESHAGYYVCRWTKGGMTYSAVSDISAQELALFVETVRTHTTQVDLIEFCR